MWWQPLVYTGILLLYYGVFCALLPILFKRVFHFPDEFVRKFQHIAFASSIFLIIHVFDTWFNAILSLVVLVLVAYPFLLFFERHKRYKSFLVDRYKTGGELRVSLLLIQASYTLLIAIFWGFFGETGRWIIPVGVMAWGVGDALAALLGKAFGKTKIKVFGVDKAKTFFGSNAMTISAGITLFLMLWLYVGIPWYGALVAATFIAPICSALELFSKHGNDTVIVPLGTTLSIYFVLWIYTLVGWVS